MSLVTWLWTAALAQENPNVAAVVDVSVLALGGRSMAVPAGWTVAADTVEAARRAA